MVNFCIVWSNDKDVAADQVAEGLLPHRFTESLSKLESESARESYKGFSGRRFCCPYRPLQLDPNYCYSYDFMVFCVSFFCVLNVVVVRDI